MQHDPLAFPRNEYVLRHFDVHGQRFTVRAWEGLPYCVRPAEPIQRLNLYAPEAFFAGESINGYIADNAPIFLPNTVGGYMPGSCARSQRAQ